MRILILALVAALASPQLLAQEHFGPREVDALPASRPMLVDAYGSAARHRLPSSSGIRGESPLPLTAAVAIDGPGDLASFSKIDADICGKPVVALLMGGSPDEVPERYAQGSPLELLPLGVPQYLVAVGVLTPRDAAKYAEAAGHDAVQVLTVEDSSHFDVIAPGHKAWEPVRELLVEKAFGKR